MDCAPVVGKIRNDGWPISQLVLISHVLFKSYAFTPREKEKFTAQTNY